MQREDIGFKTTALQVVAGIDLSGKNAIVTSGYSGIGMETARAFFSVPAFTFSLTKCRHSPGGLFEFNRSFSQIGIEVFAVHPGGIMTSLQRHMSSEDIRSRGCVDESGTVNERFKSVEEGASTSTWAATSAYLSGRGGQYLEDCSEAVIHDSFPEPRTGVMRYAVDADNADKLWDLSLSWIKR